jgi:hypothetical protein
MHNPLTDLLAFLFGSAQDYNPFGNVRYVSVVFYLSVIAGSFFVAWRNWQSDPAQRSAKHVFIWLMRLTAAGMWYQGTIWKLPLPVASGFQYWVGALAKFTALPPHAWLVTHVFVPYIAVLQPIVYLTEIFFTVALSLGLFVRLAGLIAVLFTAHLWIGLYNDPTEWPWTYIAIICAHGMFVAAEAGRSLGLDNLLRRSPPAFLTRNATLARAAMLAS